MAKRGGIWPEGRRAWERLDGWHQDGPKSTPRHPGDGDGALNALGDIGFLRRLLDQAELVAVRTARRHGKSWAEIATRLGVTRQSAWERWRDLDDASGPAPSADEPQRDLVGEISSAAAAELVERVTREPGPPPPYVIEPDARERRRQSSVLVPNVVGMSWDDARRVLREKRLVAVGPDPDGPPLAALGWPDGVVTDQSPESGAKVPAGSVVTLWIGRGRGGSAGVREPRRPGPTPKSARAMRDEPGDDAPVAGNSQIKLAGNDVP